MPDHQTSNTKRSARDPVPRSDPTGHEDPAADRARTGAAEDPSRNGASEPTQEREPWAGWPSRDILAPFVLLAVSLQRAHGYVIEDYLRALGLFGITMSTLYRTLRQMEKDGFVESTWEPGPTGPARRVYSITDAGMVWLDSSATMLSAYRETIDRFFGLYGADRAQRDGTSDQRAGEKETSG